MKFLKKLEFGIRQSVELYIPAISFVVMFCLFCYQILVRYVISKFTNLVVPWTTEVEQSCFLWIALLGACYVQRNKGHVVFTMVYDALKLKGKAVMALVSNAFVAFAMAITFIPSFKYIWGLTARHQVTSLLKIPKTLVFFPYVIFLGEDEIKDGVVACKDMKSGEQTKLNTQETIDRIKAGLAELEKGSVIVE